MRNESAKHVAMLYSFILFSILVIDECESFPCENGGTCIDGIDYFICHCPSGYTGDYCETSGAFQLGLMSSCLGIFYVDFDECVSYPCQNGGTCFDDIGGYTCVCILGHTGDNCETSSILLF